MRGSWLGLLAVLWGCARYQDGVFRKDGLRYAVPAPDARLWRPIHLNENDLAWMARDTGDVLAVNATCEDYGDPPLDVLTNHLLIGFTDRQALAATTEMVDGREALRTRCRAKLDGVPVELELVVLKKNGCVHDFTLVAPIEGRDTVDHRADFDALVTHFRQEAAP